MTIKTKICKLWEKVFSENQKKRKLLDKAKEQENKVANLIYRIKKLEEKMEGKSESAPIYQNDEIATGNGEHRD